MLNLVNKLWFMQKAPIFLNINSLISTDFPSKRTDPCPKLIITDADLTKNVIMNPDPLERIWIRTTFYNWSLRKLFWKRPSWQFSKLDLCTCAGCRCDPRAAGGGCGHTQEGLLWLSPPDQTDQWTGARRLLRGQGEMVGSQGNRSKMVDWLGRHGWSSTRTTSMCWSSTSFILKWHYFGQYR